MTLSRPGEARMQGTYKNSKLDEFTEHEGTQVNLNGKFSPVHSSCKVVSSLQQVIL